MNRAELLTSIRNITGETNNQIYNSCCERILENYHVFRPSQIDEIHSEVLNAGLKSYLIRVREAMPDEGIEGGGKRKKSKKSKKVKKSKKSRKLS